MKASYCINIFYQLNELFRFILNEKTPKPKPTRIKPSPRIPNNGDRPPSLGDTCCAIKSELFCAPKL